MKENLLTGDILHCRGNRWISKMIMWFTKSQWSHTAIFAMIEGHPCVIEAQKNGVNVKTFDNWVKEYNYYYEVSRKIGGVKDRVFLNKALSKAGVTGYDFISLLVRHPWKIITGSWREMSKHQEDDKMYCSEYVAWCHNLGWDYANQMTPADVYNYCEINHTEWLKIK
jgi:hypothetical protein